MDFLLTVLKAVIDRSIRPVKYAHDYQENLPQAPLNALEHLDQLYPRISLRNRWRAHNLEKVICHIYAHQEQELSWSWAHKHVHAVTSGSSLPSLGSTFTMTAKLQLALYRGRRQRRCLHHTSQVMVFWPSVTSFTVRTQNVSVISYELPIPSELGKTAQARARCILYVNNVLRKGLLVYRSRPPSLATSLQSWEGLSLLLCLRTLVFVLFIPEYLCVGSRPYCPYRALKSRQVSQQQCLYLLYPPHAKSKTPTTQWPQTTTTTHHQGENIRPTCQQRPTEPASL